MKNRWTLNIRLFVVTLCVSIPVIAMILWINSYNLENLRKERVAESQAEVEAAVSQLDTMMELLENSVINLSINNPDFQVVAKATEENTDFWRANQRLMRKITNLTKGSSFQFYIFVYYPKVDLFYNNKVDPEMTKAIRDLIDNKDEVPLKRRWSTIWSNDKAYIVRIIDYESYDLGAWLEYGSLYRKLGLVSDEDVKYYFVDENGRVLNSREEISIDTSGNVYRDGRGSRWYVASALSGETDYRFVKLINEKALKKELPKVTESIFLVAGILVLLFTVYILCIYRWVIGPISHMKKSMAVIEAGNMEYRIPNADKTSVEFESVIDQFNSMMDQLQNLKIEVYEGKLEQQETKLQYLSQQIQPHFMLNTLNTLYNFSDRDKQATREIIMLLSKYYRHVVNVNSKYVLLGQELEHIENYLKLQKIRYPKAFEYGIKCSPPLEIIPVPPFIIESFVGNAIKYGLRPGETSLLQIDVEELEQFKIRIRISDTGNGFSEDDLDSIREFIEEGSVSEELGVGIRNSIERLRLIYQNRAAIRFYNQQPHGAVIEIDIVLQE
ncbi:MAG TPA: histidine kinase [Clostridiales bacterium]|nr:histidine kinase [Clostridiales bacterium]